MKWCCAHWLLAHWRTLNGIACSQWALGILKKAIGAGLSAYTYTYAYRNINPDMQYENTTRHSSAESSSRKKNIQVSLTGLSAFLSKTDIIDLGKIGLVRCILHFQD
jgi:hypothetical protein